MRRDMHSPNFSSRAGAGVSMLVMHYTGMPSGREAIARLCEEVAKVSAHYVIEEDGTVWNLVDEAECAWHAGLSYWRGHRNVNNISIGIEIVNPGHEWGYRTFPQVQMEAVAELSRGIVARHSIEPHNVVAHSDVAPARKEDPGELFDWQWLAGQGVGLWPVLEATLSESMPLGEDSCGEPVLRMQRDLAAYGYDVPQNGVYDAATIKTAIAFQRHFRPSDIGGIWDKECARRLQALLDLTLA